MAKGKLPSLLKGGLVGATVVICALLLTIDAKFWGVVVMGAAVIILFFLPWLDYSPVKSIRYRPDWHKYVYAVFVINFLILGYLGVKPPSPIGERGVPSGYPVLLWLLPADALVEQAGHIQTSA